MKQETIKKICVSAIFIALSTVLSMVKILDLKAGGAVTLFSMLPICLISLLFDLKWGVFSACLYGLIQLLQGADSLAYATWWGAAIVIILFDFIVAFGVLGLAGMFKKIIKNQSVACIAGVTLVCFLRFLCHFITGVTVWKKGTGWDAIWYSITYNGAYMLPELVLTTIAAVLLMKYNVLGRLLKIKA